mgnify:FL=1
MAKYLGGTDSQQEEVKAQLETPGLLSNDFVLDVSTGIFSSEKIGIKDNITYYEEVTQENETKFSIGWGIVGLAIFGPLGALAGAILGGDNKTKHVVAAQLNNGLKFVVQLDQDEFVKWVNLMPHKAAPQGEEV